MKYAAQTDVPSDKSRVEIERTLKRYGATSFAYGWQQGFAVISFEAHSRRIRFNLPMPDKNERRFTHTAHRNTARSTAQAEAEYEQAVRQKWRALMLVIKAKLEAVDAEITVFEDEFMAHIQLPNGQSVGDWMKPQIEQAYLKGDMPPLLGYSGVA